nr:MAG TPA: hypothetical protein [Caudoviricetes sp.]
MGLVAQFGSDYIGNKVSDFQKRLEAAGVFMLKYLGEDLAKYAKDNHNYTDQTGNLTNSIGYAVVRNKEIIYCDATNQPGEGSDAMLKAALKVVDGLTETLSLIIVAGMNYAAYVEAKGYNVILPAELKAKKDFPIAMAKLVEKARKRALLEFGII